VTASGEVSRGEKMSLRDRPRVVYHRVYLVYKEKLVKAGNWPQTVTSLSTGSILYEKRIKSKKNGNEVYYPALYL